MASYSNRSFNDFDATYTWQGSWGHGIAWGNPNTSIHGSLSFFKFSESPYANVTFPFPVPGVAFYYWGFQRSKGGRYGICTDCNPAIDPFDIIDAVNLTDGGYNPPRVLYSKRWDTPGIHTVTLWNLPDSRFPQDTSEITLEHFDVEIVNTSSHALSLSTPSSSSVSTNDAQQSTKPSAPVGTIAGSVLGGIFGLIAFALLLWLFLKRRRDGRELDLTAEESGFGEAGPTVRLGANPQSWAEHTDLSSSSVGSSEWYTPTSASQVWVIDPAPEVDPRPLPPSYNQATRISSIGGVLSYPGPGGGASMSKLKGRS
ncbi:hypothetical protein P691DRAFT_766511 [Macrolepiota fuliginosa MF-IS2]|uniref:Transmembrane protein n=1 Tax=Macrolepiota fuliginosa MF-IS2 TaxID=1400762 RepID=A0A9P5X0T3_9AGAR|nr:hypothetical protein P691DRAFT_766511 [Macrolepiota fuliginosa MF-IS2]